MLTLTGFSTTGGKSKSGGSKSGGGGGGCSSSKQDHDSSSATGGYNTRPTNAAPTPTATGGSSGPLKDGVARVLACASAEQPYALIEVRNPNRAKTAFSVTVHFEDARGEDVDVMTESLTVPGSGTKAVQVPFDVQYADDLVRCVLSDTEPEARRA